eukprot:CAMPEP_0197837080 /NCGR_PEP_ID=MMETSP1437-20131217/31065_1 /TAXON_ID=49252 ORGANISM="Eucampia antarctica, Strain CCMP1452" /NCGR_SAMPLE_ID=MMETSP1437 /ASSEMBLY_ACC=CAM_ASM_001096 /LENGTH=288 /DNA_ID=CAMNT_0043443817 /DNA_START=130 /DNA_END=996 /DNA_ORIENTATION=+
MTTYCLLIHVLSLCALTVVHKCKYQTLILTAILFPLNAFGVTVGAHRYWTHRSFEAGLPVRIFLMLCQSLSNQGSILHWCKDHRVHHRYSETDADPHDARRGFFYAHIGWLLMKKDPKVIKAGKEMNCFQDLYDDPVVMFQAALDPWFQLFLCFYVPAYMSASLWGESYWYAFLVAGIFRQVFQLHVTFMVNSAAHMFGNQPYDVTVDGRDNRKLNYFMYGEGWHNWHHKYPYDYAASELGISHQFNPSKLLIDTFSYLGLAWKRKRATGAWERRKKTLQVEKKGKMQ